MAQRVLVVLAGVRSGRSRAACANCSTRSSPSARISILPAMLRRIVEAAVGLVDARYGALGVLDDTGSGLAEFITVGIDDDVHRLIGDLPKGTGSSAGSSSTPSRCACPTCASIPTSFGFPPHHPPMRSFLGVPIRVRDEVFGNLYLTDKTAAEVFTDVDEELVVALAARPASRSRTPGSTPGFRRLALRRGPRAHRPRPPRHRDPTAVRHRPVVASERFGSCGPTPTRP